MRREQFFKKHALLDVPLREIERKWNVFIMEQQMIKLSMNKELSPTAPMFNSIFSTGGGTVLAPESSGTIVFNGTNAYVQVPNITLKTWLPDTADFTVEWFMKQTGSGSGFPRVWSIYTDIAATMGCSIEGGSCYIWAGGAWINGSMPAGFVGNWVYVAVSRTSGTTRLYIDGHYKSKSSDVKHISDTIHPGAPLYMGGDGATNWWQGSLTNFRWTNTGLYTSETTIPLPTEPLAKLAETKMLLLGGSEMNPVVDSTGINTLIDFNTMWSSNSPF